MLGRVLTVSENALIELVNRKAVYVLVVMLMLGFVAPVYLQAKLLGYAGPTSRQAPLGYHALIFPWEGFVLWLGLAAAVLYGAGSIESEVSRRTLSAVMIRPIHRWEYLLGRAMGVGWLFFLFVLTTVLCSYGAAFWLGCSLPEGALWGILQRLCRGFAWIVITVSLGSVLSSVTTVMLIVVVALIGSLVPSIPEDLHTIVPTIKGVVHYLTPAALTTDFLSGAPRPGGFSFWDAAILLDNLAYGVAVFLGCSWVFTKRDLPLRE